MSKKRSHFDELHDRYYTLLSTKLGTRYERLTAIVFKYLDQNATVIHDIKLLVDNQIDVTIEHNGKQQRTILECKDMDVSGRKVGRSVIQKFHAVIADIRPDKAYVVTCNGFTRHAETYAKSKDIGLVVLREFQESDWDRHIRFLKIAPVVPSTPKVYIGFKKICDSQKISEDIKRLGLEIEGLSSDNKPIFFNTPEGRFQAVNFIRQNMVSVNTPPGIVKHDIDVSNVTIEVDNCGPVELSCLNISYEIFDDGITIDICGNRIAELLLQEIGSESKVIWDDDLRQFRIDESSREVLSVLP
jgi:hypothetical protein